MVAISADLAAIGISTERVLGRTRWELAGADPDADPEWRAHREAMEAHEPFRDFRFAHQTDHGKLVWRTSSGNPVFDEVGSFQGYRGTSRDITLEVEARLAVERSEKKLADFLATAADWSWETDQEHRFVATSSQPAEMGLAAERLLGNTRWEMAGADADGDPTWRAHRETMEAREPFHDFRYALTTEAGERVWRTSSGNPMFGEDGSFQGYRGTSRDITLEVEARLAVERSEKKLADLLATAADWFWESDKQHRFVTITAPLDLYGIPRERVIGHTRWALAGADVENDPKWVEHLALLRAYRPFRDLRYSVVNRDGAVLSLLASGNPVFDPPGIFRGYRGTARDITGEARIQEMLREAEERVRGEYAQLEAIYDQLPVGLCFYDADLRLVRANAVWAALHGVVLEDTLGKRIDELSASPEGRRALELHQSVLEGGMPLVDLSYQAARIGDAAEIRDWRVSYFPAFLQGRAIGVNAIIRDVTEAETSRPENSAAAD